MGLRQVDVDVDEVDEVEWKKKKENKRRGVAPWKKLSAAAYCHLDIDNDSSISLFIPLLHNNRNRFPFFYSFSYSLVHVNIFNFRFASNGRQNYTTVVRREHYTLHIVCTTLYTFIMPPSEESILSNFLLSPAPLPTVISLQKFTELFPKRLRSHPHIRTLYRELQQVREQDMDRVNENIDNEIKQGETQRAELRKAILATGVEASSSEEREMDMDVHLFGQPPTAVPGNYHSVASLLAEMETASANVEREIAGIDQEAAKILAQLNTTVGDISGLRYGKLQGPRTAEDIAGEAIKGLQNLEDVCYKNSAS